MCKTIKQNRNHIFKSEISSSKITKNHTKCKTLRLKDHVSIFSSTLIAFWKEPSLKDNMSSHVVDFRQQIQARNIELSNFCTPNYFAHKFRDEYKGIMIGRTTSISLVHLLLFSKYFHKISFDSYTSVLWTQQRRHSIPVTNLLIASYKLDTTNTNKVTNHPASPKILEFLRIQNFHF